MVLILGEEELVVVVVVVVVWRRREVMALGATLRHASSRGLSRVWGHALSLR